MNQYSIHEQQLARSPEIRKDDRTLAFQFNFLFTLWLCLWLCGFGPTSGRRMRCRTWWFWFVFHTCPVSQCRIGHSLWILARLFCHPVFEVLRDLLLRRSLSRISLHYVLWNCRGCLPSWNPLWNWYDFHRRFRLYFAFRFSNTALGRLRIARCPITNRSVGALSFWSMICTGLLLFDSWLRWTGKLLAFYCHFLFVSIGWFAILMSCILWTLTETS